MQASSHLHQPPQTPVGMGDAGTFADAANLDHCAKYLNQTLVTFGFPASLDLFATDPVLSTHSLLLRLAGVPHRRHTFRVGFAFFSLSHFQAIVRSFCSFPS
jgi:hypothetical protein